MAHDDEQRTNDRGEKATRDATRTAARAQRQGRDVRNEGASDPSEAQEPVTPYTGAQQALNRECDRLRPFPVDRRVKFQAVKNDDGRCLTEWDPYRPERER